MGGKTRRFSFVLIWLGLLPLLLLGYSNCANYQENDLFNGSQACPEGNCSLIDGQVQSIRVLSTDLTLQCYEDSFGIGGNCNAGDSEKNYIAYSISRANNPIPWGTGSQAVTELKDASCENGRFNLIVRRPNDPNAPTTTQKVEYDLNLKIMFKTADSSDFKLGSQYTERIYVQYGGCPNPAGIPAPPPSNISAVISQTQ